MLITVSQDPSSTGVYVLSILCHDSAVYLEEID